MKNALQFIFCRDGDSELVDYLLQIKERIGGGHVSLIEIDHLIVHPEDRRTKVGTRMIERVLGHGYTEDVIFAVAGPSQEDYPQEDPDDNELANLLSRLHSFYTSLKFANINFMTEHKMHAPYLYIGNEIGLLMFNEIENEYKKLTQEYKDLLGGNK